MNFKNIFDEIINEEEIGTLIKNGNFRYCVYAETDNVPHLHFIEGDPKNPISLGSLRLDTRGYFDHGKHRDRLPKREFKFILEYLSNDNNYEKAVSYWNEYSKYPVVIQKDKDGNIINNPYKN